jgi:hypothetical protein
MRLLNERETFVIICHKFYENLCYYGSSSEVYVSYSDNQTKFIHCVRELIVCLIKVEIKTVTHHLILYFNSVYTYYCQDVAQEYGQHICNFCMSCGLIFDIRYIVNSLNISL